MNEALDSTTLAKRLLKKQTQKRRANQKFRDLAREEAELEAALRQAILAEKKESIRVNGYHFTPSHRDIAELHDWSALWAYVVKHDAPEFMHKRVSLEACRERWEHAEAQLLASRSFIRAEPDEQRHMLVKARALAVPGVRPGTQPTLSVEKARPIKGAK